MTTKRISPHRHFWFSILISAATLGGGALLSSNAFADPTPSEKAASDALFKDAKKLVEQGRFNDACPKFEESERLDPTPGTLLNLGDCYKASAPPRNASALGAYRQAEVMARQRSDKPRQDAALQRVQAVESLVSKVTIAVPSAAQLPGLEITWDGRAIGQGMFGTAFPADAGEHTLSASAPGYQTWTRKSAVGANASSTTLDVPILLVATEAKPSTPTLTPARSVPEAPYWGGQRIAGVVVGVAGLGGLVVGSIFGLQAAKKNSDAAPHCLPSNPRLCDAEGVSLGEDAYGPATVSTIGFIAGGVALAGGVLLFVTAPSATSNGSGKAAAGPAVGLNLGLGSASFRGAW
jgi:serine/threonine-protein kinase